MMNSMVDDVAPSSHVPAKRKNDEDSPPRKRQALETPTSPSTPTWNQLHVASRGPLPFSTTPPLMQHAALSTSCSVQTTSSTTRSTDLPPRARLDLDQVAELAEGISEREALLSDGSAVFAYWQQLLEMHRNCPLSQQATESFEVAVGALKTFSEVAKDLRAVDDATRAFAVSSTARNMQLWMQFVARVKTTKTCIAKFENRHAVMCRALRRLKSLLDSIEQYKIARCLPGPVAPRRAGMLALVNEYDRIMNLKRKVEDLLLVQGRAALSTALRVVRDAAYYPSLMQRRMATARHVLDVLFAYIRQVLAFHTRVWTPPSQGSSEIWTKSTFEVKEVKFGALEHLPDVNGTRDPGLPTRARYINYGDVADFRTHFGDVGLDNSFSPEVLEVDGTFYLIDGNHRVAALRAMDDAELAPLLASRNYQGRLEDMPITVRVAQDATEEDVKKMARAKNVAITLSTNSVFYTCSAMDTAISDALGAEFSRAGSWHRQDYTNLTDENREDIKKMEAAVEKAARGSDPKMQCMRRTTAMLYALNVNGFLYSLCKDVNSFRSTTSMYVMRRVAEGLVRSYEELLALDMAPVVQRHAWQAGSVVSEDAQLTNSILCALAQCCVLHKETFRPGMGLASIWRDDLTVDDVKGIFFSKTPWAAYDEEYFKFQDRVLESAREGQTSIHAQLKDYVHRRAKTMANKKSIARKTEGSSGQSVAKETYGGARVLDAEVEKSQEYTQQLSTVSPDETPVNDLFPQVESVREFVCGCRPSVNTAAVNNPAPSTSKKSSKKSNRVDYDKNKASHDDDEEGARERAVAVNSLSEVGDAARVASVADSTCSASSPAEAGAVPEVAVPKTQKPAVHSKRSERETHRALRLPCGTRDGVTEPSPVDIGEDFFDQGEAVQRFASAFETCKKKNGDAPSDIHVLSLSGAALLAMSSALSTGERIEVGITTEAFKRIVDLMSARNIYYV
ncbi:hypothetical protein SDRG_16354 [Saprolegnia diclina VS20]|uniref:Uncharacterized protein n=1 Tax=Saprolegnia diclina (strain VS20) TaxID=1156394 RepID=T0PU28_SAPDV|nr:hypothetical protein SDRG_16354 [Saprolegnia diclina VS20]EQC25756.1 hypothetical protein SDRG_16354 [Saprolegnia diclina VS20]|eukprot:XP_008620781.1 hypothetical protein SDRG_16354 [Saprolegnia diclina VS20]